MRIVGEFGPDEIRVRASRARLANAVFVIAMVAFSVVVYGQRPERFGTILLYSLLLGIAGLVAFVAWIKWFHAVHDIVVAADRARFRGSWWAWAWLIPGVSLAIPKMMLNDLWNAARSVAGPRTQSTLLQAWWASHVLAGALRFVARGDEFPVFEVVAWIASFVSYFLSIWVIREVTEVALLTQAAYQRASIEPPSTGITQPVT